MNWEKIAFTVMKYQILLDKFFLTWKWAKEVKEDLVEADNFAYCVCKKKKQQASKMY